MKKMLLTMCAGFFISAVSMAQTAPKAAAKKTNSALKPVAGVQQSSSPRTAKDEAKLKARLAKMQAVESGKAAPASSTKESKAKLAVENAN